MRPWKLMQIQTVDFVCHRLIKKQIYYFHAGKTFLKQHIIQPRLMA
jgi:hypothetical protein